MAKNKATAPTGGGAEKPKKEKKQVRPVPCVCGRTPCAVKHRSKTMLACPDLMECAMRSRWLSNEQAAIEDWNITVESAKQEAKKRARRKQKTV